MCQGQVGPLKTGVRYIQGKVALTKPCLCCPSTSFGWGLGFLLYGAAKSSPRTLLSAGRKYWLKASSFIPAIAAPIWPLEDRQLETRGDWGGVAGGCSVSHSSNLTPPGLGWWQAWMQRAEKLSLVDKKQINCTRPLNEPSASFR